MKIHQLDEMTANKIAAGEVIERPANVVKELVENSIDASSTVISILVNEGGMERIRVIDNGEGMFHQDALMCFSRHATSKIMDDHDLFNITTLGFRGEAIPSIAAISHFTLQTNNGEESSRIVYEFGKRKEAVFMPFSKGTGISVEKIFQNVPARLKYMKSVNAEFAAIYNYVEKLALSHPEVSFSLFHNDRQIFKTNGSGNLLEVISSIYGLSVAKDMIFMDQSNDEFHIYGYLSPFSISRSSKNHIITLVNGRYVKNMMAIHTIDDVYRQYLMDRRYPIVVVNIDVDPYLIDVNVHPAKLEVRFSKEDSLKELIISSIENVFIKKEEPHNEPAQAEVFKPDFTNEIELIEPEYRQTDMNINQMIAESKESYSDKETKLIKPIKEKLYVSSQIHGQYIVAYNEKGMYLISQKKAMMRILYEKYRDHYSNNERIMQPLLVPIILEYSKSEYLLIEEHKDLLASVGIILETVGPHQYAVREMPLWMDHIDEKLFIEEMIEQVLRNHQIDIIQMLDKAILALVRRDTLLKENYLTHQEMQSLCDDLMRCDHPFIDPQGGMTVIYYSMKDLDQLFKKVDE